MNYGHKGTFMRKEEWEVLPEIDVSLAKRVHKRMKTSDESICFSCTVPIVECQWIMEQKAYEGSRYWKKIVSGQRAGKTGVSYAIKSCPMYKGEVE